MIRLSAVGLVGVGFMIVLGCQLPAERLGVKPLPEDGQPLPYADMLQRARLQANAATEAFYVDGWAELEESARGLEQTARRLAGSSEIPESVRPTLAARADDLATEAGQLKEAAKGRDVKQTNLLMQRINLVVRELRTER